MKTQAPLSRFIPCYLSNCGGGDERNESLVAALPYSDETKVAVLDQNGVPLACHYRSQVIGWLANTPWAITWLNGTVTALDTIGELEKQWKASPDNVDLARKLAEVARTLGRCDLACECYDALDRIAKMPANAETVETLAHRLEAMIDVDYLYYFRNRKEAGAASKMKVSEKTFQFFAACIEQLISAKDKAAACHFATQGRLIVGWWCPDVSAGLALVERLIAAFPATTALEGDTWQEDLNSVADAAGRMAILGYSDEAAERGLKAMKASLEYRYVVGRRDAKAGAYLEQPISADKFEKHVGKLQGLIDAKDGEQAMDFLWRKSDAFLTKCPDHDKAFAIIERFCAAFPDQFDLDNFQEYFGTNIMHCAKDDGVATRAKKLVEQAFLKQYEYAREYARDKARERRAAQPVAPSGEGDDSQDR